MYANHLHLHSLCYLFQASCSFLKPFIFILIIASKIALSFQGKANKQKGPEPPQLIYLREAKIKMTTIESVSLCY